MSMIVMEQHGIRVYDDETIVMVTMI